MSCVLALLRSIHRHPARTGILSLLLALLGAAPVRAQDGSAYRVGISLGGVSTIGLILEREFDSNSVELIVGTWAFRDLSVSLEFKRYMGGGEVQGVVGVGLWTVLAFPPDERMGAALVARVPLGVQWEVSGDHAVGAEVGLGRALAIRRTDPEDDTPMNRRIVPLPGLSYRWRSR